MHSDIGFQWITFYALNNNVTYFWGFSVEHIQKEIKDFFEGSSINKPTITTNIYRIQPYDSVMFGYFYIWLLDFLLKGKSLTDLNFSSPNNF